MTSSGTRVRRSEIVATALVVLVVAAAVFALWPRTATPAGPASSATDVVAPQAAVPAAELAPLQNAAGLAPCPTGSGAPAAGPLAAITVDCLGTTGRIGLGAALAGRPTLLNLWASWCGPCRAELPAIAEYAARPEAVAVLGVDVSDDPRPALQMLTELGVHLPSVTDPDGAVRAALSAPPGVPLSFLVRADGSVAIVTPPTPFTSADEVASAVKRLS